MARRRYRPKLGDLVTITAVARQEPLEEEEGELASWLGRSLLLDDENFPPTHPRRHDVWILEPRHLRKTWWLLTDRSMRYLLAARCRPATPAEAAAWRLGG